MNRDIDAIIERIRLLYPAVEVQQLKVKFPADDDGLWFFTHPNVLNEVQFESSYGAYPFLIENDENLDRDYVHNIEEAVKILVKLLHLQGDIESSHDASD